MAISIDTVYQKVLAFANKEQRGYITPQEFNLFANQAQIEIFEQYFYDLDKAARIPGNDSIYADVDDMLEEKIQRFECFDPIATLQANVGTTINTPSIPVSPSQGQLVLPDYIYRVHRIQIQDYPTVKCEILTTEDFATAISGPPLIRSGIAQGPIANIRNNILTCYFGITPINPSGIYYFRRPTEVRWGYVVITGSAMYDPGSTIDFQLHQSEESELVYKILKYTGVSMKREDISSAGQNLEHSQIQQEKQ